MLILPDVLTAPRCGALLEILQETIHDVPRRAEYSVHLVERRAPAEELKVGPDIPDSRGDDDLGSRRVKRATAIGCKPVKFMDVGRCDPWIPQHTVGEDHRVVGAEARSPGCLGFRV
jgi:hypothetical protein